jgi:guanine nucleotide-binding protein subunit alpha
MCFGGDKSGEDPDAKKSKEIEKQLREDQKKMAKEVKMLLLGKKALQAQQMRPMAY